MNKRIKFMKMEEEQDETKKMSFLKRLMIKSIFSKKLKTEAMYSVIRKHKFNENFEKLEPETVDLDSLLKPEEASPKTLAERCKVAFLLHDKVGHAEEEGRYSYINMFIDVNELSEKKPIPFSMDGMCCELVISNRTKYIGVNTNKEYNVIIKKPLFFDEEYESGRAQCECLYIVDDFNYRLFTDYDFDERIEKLKVFSRLSEKQREYVLHLYDQPKIEREGKRNPIMDIKSLEFLYETCGKSFPQNIQDKVEELFEQLDSDFVSSSDRADLINRLSHMLNTKMYSEKKISKTYEEIIAILDKHIYGMKELKEYIGERIMMMQYTSLDSISLLLVGNPGVGKTSVVNAIAECFERKIVEIDCEGSDAINIKGLFSSWGGARSGKIAEGLWTEGDSEVVVFLEELDKISIGDKGNPYDALIKPLGPDKQFYDEYVGIDYDVSNTIWVATANDVSKIPDYIQNRFNKIIYLDDYSVEDKVAIATNYTIPSLLKELNIDLNRIMFTEEALRIIASDYCFDAGIRDMRSNIDDLICKVISGWARNIFNDPFEIDETFVRENLVKSQEEKKSRCIGFTA